MEERNIVFAYSDSRRDDVARAIVLIEALRGRCDRYNFAMRTMEELGSTCREIGELDEPFELYLISLGLLDSNYFREEQESQLRKRRANCYGARRTSCIAF